MGFLGTLPWSTQAELGDLLLPDNLGPFHEHVITFPV